MEVDNVADDEVADVTEGENEADAKEELDNKDDMMFVGGEVEYGATELS